MRSASETHPAKGREVARAVPDFASFSIDCAEGCVCLAPDLPVRLRLSSTADG